MSTATESEIKQEIATKEAEARQCEHDAAETIRDMMQAIERGEDNVEHYETSLQFYTNRAQNIRMVIYTLQAALHT